MKHRAIEVIGRDKAITAFVRNAGAGGMQLQYVSEEEMADQWRRISIIASDGVRNLITDISCRVVYDLRSLMENGTFRGLNARICGLSFTLLPQAKEAIYNQLIAQLSVCNSPLQEQVHRDASKMP